MLFDVGMPGADVVERALIGDIVYEEDAHSTSVVCGGDCPEAFLACGVPYLELDAFTIEFDCAYFEVDTNRCDEGGCPGVVAKAEEETGLADTGVADEKELDQKVVVRWWHGGRSRQACRHRASRPSARR